jgi:hypothetical protein
VRSSSTAPRSTIKNQPGNCARTSGWCSSTLNCSRICRLSTT